MIPLRFDKDKKIMVEEEWLAHPDPIEKRKQDYEIKTTGALTVKPPKYELPTIRVEQEDIPLVNKLAPFYQGSFQAAVAIHQHKASLERGLTDVSVDNWIEEVIEATKKAWKDEWLKRHGAEE